MANNASHSSSHMLKQLAACLSIIIICSTMSAGHNNKPTKTMQYEWCVGLSSAKCHKIQLWATTRFHVINVHVKWFFFFHSKYWSLSPAEIKLWTSDAFFSPNLEIVRWIHSLFHFKTLIAFWECFRLLHFRPSSCNERSYSLKISLLKAFVYLRWLLLNCFVHNIVSVQL